MQSSTFLTTTRFTEVVESKFVAFDGEAIDNSYCLLATRTNYIYAKKRLSAKDCLNFLLDNLPKGKIGVFFGMHYDIVNILHDLSEASIETLNEYNEIFCEGYKIVYFPRKIFSVSHKGKTAKFYDVWGFYQSSFERAISEHLGVKDKIISEGKQNRSTFTRKNYREIIKYNSLECQYLEQMCDKLESIVSEFHLTSWQGASAISSSVLKKLPFVQTNKNAEIELDDTDKNMIHAGYYGGRIEALQLGHIKTAVCYDLVSAYPSAMLTLPVLTKFRRHKNYIEGRQGYYVIEYKSDLFDSHAPTPFPQHVKNRLVYAASCETTTTHHEYEAFLDLCAKHPTLYKPNQVKIICGLTVPNATSELAEKVQELFATRKRLKSENDPRQMAYKLALNSMYGKFAQKVGTPKYSIYFWAGLITGHCRAQMLRLASNAIENVVMFATDSITFDKSVKLPESKNLGGQELAHEGSVNVLMSGMYKWSDGSSAKIRGFLGLDFDTAYKTVNETGEYIHHGKMLVGFNPPKALVPYRGSIINYPKRLRLDANIKRVYDSFDIDLLTEHTYSNPHLSSDMICGRDAEPESELDLEEL